MVEVAVEQPHVDALSGRSRRLLAADGVIRKDTNKIIKKRFVGVNCLINKTTYLKN